MIIYSFLSLSELSKIRECSHSHKMRMLFSTAVLLFWSDNFMECNFPGTRKTIHITARLLRYKPNTFFTSFSISDENQYC